MLSPEVEEKVLELYKDLRKIVESKKVTEGYLSNNRIISNKKQKFFLKQYEQGYTIEHIEAIFKASEFFSSKNLPIIMPIKNSLKQLYFQIDSDIYALFPFVESNTVDRHHIKKKNIISLAETLAKIHLLSSKSIPIQIGRYQNIADK